MFAFVLAAVVPGALAAPADLDPVAARLSGRLREAARLHALGAVDTFRATLPEPPPVDGIPVSVEVSDPLVVLDALDAAGITVEAAAGDRVQAFVPYERLHEVAAMPGVVRVREPWRASAKEEVSEGYAAIMESDWRAEGFDGAGVRVAIVDVGFERLDASGNAEVPEDRVTDFTRGRWDASTHGTAVTEIVYDFAPGATYYLVSIETEVELAEALEWLADEDVDVINASVGYDNLAHADGDSFVSRAVDAVVESGAIYVAPAGNENHRYRVGALAREVGGGITLAGARETRAWSTSGYVDVSLRWSEPFGAAVTDLDLVLYNEDGTECGRSADPQSGAGDPFERVTAIGCSELVAAVVEAEEGVDVTGLEGYLYARWDLEEADWTNTEDLTLPADSRLGVSVGAWSLDADAVPFYSSRGPTNDGRIKPDVVAPTGVTTATYAPNPFDGTSAATPHVAGLAALWVQASNRREQPEAFTRWLHQHARDVGAPGPDAESGLGLARADALPERCGCAGAGLSSSLGLALAGLAAARRRQ